METQYDFKELFKFTNPYTRKRYWGTIAFGIIINIVLAVVLGGLTAVFPPLMLVSFGISIAFWWVFYATVIKRLRDADMNLWWALTLFLPFLNLIAMIVFGCIGSKQPKNDKPAKPVVITGVILALVTLLLPIAIVTAGWMMINANSSYAPVPVEAEAPLPVTDEAPAPAAEAAPAAEVVPAPVPADEPVAPQVDAPRGQ